jgi:hypothetical protein
MILLNDAARSNKAKKAAKLMLNILDGLSFQDAQDAINNATERLEHTMKENVFHDTV